VSGIMNWVCEFRHEKNWLIGFNLLGGSFFVITGAWEINLGICRNYFKKPEKVRYETSIRSCKFLDKD